MVEDDELPDSSVSAIFDDVIYFSNDQKLLCKIYEPNYSVVFNGNYRLLYDCDGCGLESNLENEVIDKLEHFLLELGKGFLFSGRQVRFSFDEKYFYVDLVFYNRLLKCFVLIDLKIGELKHQDLGQMQMYVNYYDRKIKNEDDENDDEKEERIYFR